MRFRRLKIGDWVRIKKPYNDEICYGQLISKRKEYWFDEPFWLVNYLDRRGSGEWLPQELTRLTDKEAILLILEQ